MINKEKAKDMGSVEKPQVSVSHFSSGKELVKKVYYKNFNVSNFTVGERAQTIPISSEEELFEEMFPGQTYRPIKLGDTPSGMFNKLCLQFLINFENLRNYPEVLRSNMGKGNAACAVRINKSKFVISLVQKYGFRFCDWQYRSAI